MTASVLDYIFNPRSIAIAGVSPDLARPNIAQAFVNSLKDFGYKGDIYPLHPAGGEIFGLKVYKNIKDIPNNVDYVVSAIPARYTPQLITDCVVKKVKIVHLFTSGYSEIEDHIGLELENEIVKIARSGGVRLIGPNCMGTYCPATGMTFAAEYPDQKGFPKTSGQVGLVSQSGGNTIYAIRQCAERGVYFSKAISYGNATDLNESDYLEYFADDDETRLVAMYIEGLKEGQRFKYAVKKALKTKPVIINKGGNTETGARTCTSHTSAMAGSAKIWRSFIKQTGAILVEGMDELVDVIVAFTKMPVPHGRNAVVIGTGGGVGVQAADDITNAGLFLPMLNPEVRKQLNSIYGTEAGSMFRNPVDSPPFGGVKNHIRAIKAIADSNDIDIIILHFGFDIWAMVSRTIPLQPFVETVSELVDIIKKPLAIVLHYCTDPKSRVLEDEVAHKFVNMGLPVYPSISRAANAISKYITYHEYRLKNLKDRD